MLKLEIFLVQNFLWFLKKKKEKKKEIDVYETSNVETFIISDCSGWYSCCSVRRASAGTISPRRKVSVSSFNDNGPTQGVGDSEIRGPFVPPCPSRRRLLRRSVVQNSQEGTSLVKDISRIFTGVFYQSFSPTSNVIRFTCVTICYKASGEQSHYS